MTAIYKMTDGNMQTRGGFQWALHEPRTAPGGGPLYTEAWLHAYTDPLVGAFLAPVYSSFERPRLFRGEGEIGATDHGLIVGCTRAVLHEELPVPVVTNSQRVRFAILCAWEVCEDPTWRAWAEKWLAGEDRSMKAAEAAAAWAAGAEAEAWAAWAAAWAAVRAAANAAWEVAEAVARTARSAPLDLPALARRAVEEETH